MVTQGGRTVMCIVGARPNFMKIAPIIRALEQEDNSLSPYLLHTGQHYDSGMSDCFFEQLALPRPDRDLEVGSASHAVQTAEIMRRFEPVLDEIEPAVVLVVGDVNSTIACSLVSVKKGVPVVHVEAGLRSFDRNMPEEINRVLTDQISELLFTTERGALDNLLREGIDEARVHFVGNVMIDTLLHNLDRATPVDALLDGVAEAVDVSAGHGVITLHRPSNVDDPAVLKRLLLVLAEIGGELPLLFPMHPRTRARIAAFGLDGLLKDSGIIVMEPLGYLDMLGLVSRARMVFTDSGGLQEETTALGVPCITLRENTERPVTVTEGTNTIVGSDPASIRGVFREIMEGRGKAGRIPPLWDGKAAQRIVKVLDDWLAR